MTLDLSKNYLVIDGLETVSLYSKSKEGSFAAPITVSSVKRTKINKAEADLDPIFLVKQACYFHLFKDFLAGYTPKIHDKIQDSSLVNWYIKEVTQCDIDINGSQRIKCGVTKEQI